MVNKRLQFGNESLINLVISFDIGRGIFRVSYRRKRDFGERAKKFQDYA